jgi:predicted PurR-regulated permease PerM
VNPALLWVPVAFFVLMVLVFDNVVRTYIRPYLSGKAYHMGLVMFAYLLGPALFGWYGIFLGPLVMVLVVEFVVSVLPRLARGEESPPPSPGADADLTRFGGGATEPPDREGGETPSD